MLAPAGVRYVVELTAIAPVIPQVQAPAAYPVPADLTPALDRQLDLDPMFTESGVTVYANTDWLPERSWVAAPSAQAAAAAALPSGSPGVLPATSSPPGTRLVPGARPVLPGPPAQRSYAGRGPPRHRPGRAGPGRAVGPGRRDGDRRPAVVLVRLGGAVPGGRGPGSATLRFDGGPWAPLGVVVELVLWLAVAAALIERRGVVRPWARSVARRSRNRPAGADPIPGLADEPTGDLQAGADG